MIPIRKPTEQHQSSDGSGYLAAHVLYLLLSRGHSVVTTVRSPKKAQMVQKAHRNLPKSKLDLAFVEDITNPDAFSQAVITEPPSEAVTHTACPFHCKIPNTKKDLIDPAPNSATGILYAIKKHAPTVRRVVITSSSAAMIDAKYGNGAGKISSEADFNHIS